MKEKYVPTGTLSKGESINTSRRQLGRGNLMFPEWLDLKVSRDGTVGDCLIYEDNPYNRKHLQYAKNNYNSREAGSFKGMRFTLRHETRHGEPVIVIQRIV